MDGDGKNRCEKDCSTKGHTGLSKEEAREAPVARGRTSEAESLGTPTEAGTPER